MNRQAFDKAIGSFKKAIDINAMLAPAYYNIGTCYLSLGCFDSTLVWLDVADGLNPNNPTILNDLGFAYANLNNPNAAEREWRKMIAIDSTIQTAYLNLSDLYEATGQDDKHFQVLEKIVSHFSPPPFVYKRLGDIYLKRGDRIKAKEQYKSALEHGIDSSQMKDALRIFPQLKQFGQ